MLLLAWQPDHKSALCRTLSGNADPSLSHNLPR
jgi:hypothetical protein